MNAYYLSLKDETPTSSYWDYGFITDVFNNKIYRHPNYEFKIIETRKLVKEKTAIVVIPARHHKGLEHLINEGINKIDRVLLFLQGDEEAEFDIDKLDHKNLTIWVQNPHPDRHDKYYRHGCGYPPALNDYRIEIEKNIDIFFSGQNTHPRRAELLANIAEFQTSRPGTKIVVEATQGFTQGFKHKDYYNYMQRAKIAPAPCGAVIPDSFRLYEALECFAIPIADDRNSQGTIDNYWDWLFNEPTPLPKIYKYDEFVGICDNILANYEEYSAEISGWYQSWKIRFVKNIIKELNA